MLIDDYTEVMMKMNDFSIKDFKKAIHISLRKYNIPRSTDFLKFTEMSGVNHENNSLTN